MGSSYRYESRYACGGCSSICSICGVAKLAVKVKLLDFFFFAVADVRLEQKVL